MCEHTQFQTIIQVESHTINCNYLLAKNICLCVAIYIWQFYVKELSKVFGLALDLLLQ